MIVADTNLVAYLLIDGTRTAAAQAVWAKDPEWMLPTIWRSEFLNVLTTTIRADVLSLQHVRSPPAGGVLRVRALSGGVRESRAIMLV